jgi:DNA-directed RNA polymerase subunit RPC12/RpoP
MITATTNYDEAPDIRCTLCGGYYKADDLESHECEEEAQSLNEIECDICGFKSTDQDGAHYCCEDNSDD